MIAVFKSSQEKLYIKVLLKKTKPNCWEKILFSVPISLNFWLNGWVQTAFHEKQNGLQLIKISSEGDRPLLSAGLLFADQSYRTLNESLIRTLLYGCLLAEVTSLSKKKKMKKNNAIEMVPDQTKLRSKTVVIRPKCARRGYDQTQLRSKSPLIRPKCAQIRLWSDFSDQIDIWSDHLQTIVQTVLRSNFLPDTVILVWEHTGVRSTGSYHKPIWVWTSTWVTIILKIGWLQCPILFRHIQTLTKVPVNLLWCSLTAIKNTFFRQLHLNSFG